MLATALAVCACHQGRRVRFTTLAALANELQEADSATASSNGSSAATPAPSSSSSTNWAISALPDGAAELVFQVLSERTRTRIADRHDQPAVRRMDQGVPRPAAREGRRRPAHPPRAHHRHRHRELAIPPRPRTPRTQTSMTPRPEDAPAAIAAKPLALRAQPSRRQPRHAAPTGQSGNINTNNNRREVGPLQAVAPGPVQVIVPTA